MKPARSRSRRGQAGFTLVELLVALALSVIVMSALTSVVFTSVRAANTSIGRVEASSQIRTFQLRADDDFASSTVPPPNGCTSLATACKTPLVLSAIQVSNATPPVPSSESVTYSWDGSANLNRTVGPSSTHLATSVTNFWWYVDSASGTVVVQLTVTVLSYSETQTFLFHPRLN